MSDREPEFTSGVWQVRCECIGTYYVEVTAPSRDAAIHAAEGEGCELRDIVECADWRPIDAELVERCRVRFVVFESWGFLSAVGGSNYAQPPGLSVTVHDSEMLYALVGTFRTEHAGNVRSRDARVRSTRDKAEALAARLEAECDAA